MVGAVGPSDLLIHHFSIGSRASRTAYALPGRMVLVYHNITPPSYFIGVHKELVKLCFHGRRELMAYIHRCELALGDSEYNRRSSASSVIREPRSSPSFPISATSTRRRIAGSRTLDDDWTNVMFVGRVIPNKKFEDVIRAFHAYRTRHNPRSRLLLVGSYSGFENYLAMLQALIARLGTPDVHFLGHVSNEELTALYDVADLFLCASEHEGFCVPIIEAFYKRVPVLAYAATAVPGHDGWRRRAVRHQGPAGDRTADGRRARRFARSKKRCCIAGRGASTSARARDFDGTLLRFVDQTLRDAASRAHPTSPAISGSSSTSSIGSRNCGSSGPPFTGRCRFRPVYRDPWSVVRDPPRPRILSCQKQIPDPGSRIPDPGNDHQPVGPRRSQGGRDRRQRAASPRHAPRSGPHV